MEAKQKKSMLLHACCGPCSTACLERLLPDYGITVFYFNPNITDEAEYRMREAELRSFLARWQPDGKASGIGLICGRYDPQEYYTCVKGLEATGEGGSRCRACFTLRLTETARLAKEMGFDCFDTTLTVSPYKSFADISAIGCALAAEYGVEYAEGNYKKKDGYRRSIELSREYGLYRQDYCGCAFSKAEAEERRAARQLKQTSADGLGQILRCAQDDKSRELPDGTSQRLPEDRPPETAVGTPKAVACVPEGESV